MWYPCHLYKRDFSPNENKVFFFYNPPQHVSKYMNSCFQFLFSAKLINGNHTIWSRLLQNQTNSPTPGFLHNNQRISSKESLPYWDGEYKIQFCVVLWFRFQKGNSEDEWSTCRAPLYNSCILSWNNKLQTLFWNQMSSPMNKCDCLVLHSCDCLHF